MIAIARHGARRVPIAGGSTPVLPGIAAVALAAVFDARDVVASILAAALTEFPRHVRGQVSGQTDRQRASLDGIIVTAGRLPTKRRIE